MKKPERLKIENRNFWYEFVFAKNYDFFFVLIGKNIIIKIFLKIKNRRYNDALKGLVGIFRAQHIFVNCISFD